MKRQLQQFLFALFSVLPAAGAAFAAERPTMKDTRDPRPDILAHPIYDAHVPYRRAYNRPRYMSGWIASKIAPSSQEAMVWAENLRAGRYDECNMPPMYKRYYAPKPWEVLVTGPRPDKPASVAKPLIQPTSVPETPVVLPEPTNALELHPGSPSDR